MIRANTILRRAAESFRPLDPLTGSQWVDQYLYLPPECASEPGKCRVSRVSGVRWLLDKGTDDTSHEIDCIKGVQMGFTVTGLSGIIGYHIHRDPGPFAGGRENAVLKVEKRLPCGQHGPMFNPFLFG